VPTLPTDYSCASVYLLDVFQETTFLEACIENHTKSNLFMDQVDFEPAQHYSATILRGDGPHTEKDNTARSVLCISFGVKHYNINKCFVFFFLTTYILTHLV